MPSVLLLCQLEVPADSPHLPELIQFLLYVLLLSAIDLFRAGVELNAILS